LLLVRSLACDFSKGILDLLKPPEVRQNCHVCNEQKKFIITWVYSREKFHKKKNYVSETLPFGEIFSLRLMVEAR
jgi:hypothetical protein